VEKQHKWWGTIDVTQCEPGTGCYTITNSGRLDPFNSFNCVLIKCRYLQITRMWRSVALHRPWSLWRDNNFRKPLAFGNSNKRFPSNGSWPYLPTTSFWLHLQSLQGERISSCSVCVRKTKVSFAKEMGMSRACQTETGGCNWTINRKFTLQPFYCRHSLVTTYLNLVLISELAFFKGTILPFTWKLRHTS
jgi:hypothetical protein